MRSRNLGIRLRRRSQRAEQARLSPFEFAIEPQHLLGECHLASRRFKGCLVSCWAALGELPGARRDGNTI
jgi:hypothetical protein